jgi:hypothetical protein
LIYIEVKCDTERGQPVVMLKIEDGMGIHKYQPSSECFSVELLYTYLAGTGSKGPI